MANMLRNKRHFCQCCGTVEFTAGQARRMEGRGWLKDQTAALVPSRHEEDYEMSDWDWDGASANDGSDLEGIPGVTLSTYR